MDEKILRVPVRMSCEEALNRDTRSMLLTDSKGQISAEYVYLYPPGIPLLVPGEEITEELLRKFAVYKKQGLSIQGLQDYCAEHIIIVDKLQ